MSDQISLKLTFNNTIESERELKDFLDDMKGRAGQRKGLSPLFKTALIYYLRDQGLEMGSNLPGIDKLSSSLRTPTLSSESDEQRNSDVIIGRNVDDSDSINEDKRKVREAKRKKILDAMMSMTG